MITLLSTNRTRTLFISALICLFTQTGQAYAGQDNLVLLQNLKGPWLFSIGINEEWISPKYNDSNWETIKVPSPWEDQGFNGYNGYAFYRKKINIPSNYKSRMLYLNMGYIDDVDEVYLNGHKIGSTGTFPPDYNTAYNAERIYYIPEQYINFDGSNLIAVKVYDSYQEGGIVSGEIGLYGGRTSVNFDVNLQTTWKFQPGDDLRRKESDFDDSGWSEIFVPAKWEDQGYRDYDGYAWQVLDPKIQEIAKGKFHIAAYRAGEDLPFYTSNKQLNLGKINDKEPSWLLKNYLMGIELKDLTIADLTRDRIKRNLILIGLMDVIMLLGAWMIFRNVTKQVELSQLKSDFVSSVSHEIRTPLALITMYIETLEMGRVKNAKKVKEYYTVILNETTRLSGIVNRILSFSQIESNKRKYCFSETDINEIVENAALSFRYSIENKGFDYSFKPDRNIPLISVDRDAIADAFVNLIDNAMKYSTEIKDIEVRTGKSDNYIYVEVEDHGIGIPEKNQKYIFDKFYRVTEMNLANKVKGSGLGLAIVKHIIDAHEGKISVKSAPGSGSTFRLSFPVKVT